MYNKLTIDCYLLDIEKYLLQYTTWSNLQPAMYQYILSLFFFFRPIVLLV